jgi:hypothetical protein
MEDRRCKLGLQGRLQLVWLIEQGASEDERASRSCLGARATRPGSCPWRLSDEQERAILTARETTNYGLTAPARPARSRSSASSTTTVV